MKRNSYVHCSFDLVESFKPRVPKTRVIGKFVSEEAETPRICTADTIQHALLGIPGCADVMQNIQKFDMRIYIHVYYLTSEDIKFPTEEEVPDVKERNLVLSICKRGDDDSMVMARFDPKANKQVLPINEKADRLTRDFQLFSDNCKILLRDGKVSAVLSKEYVILPADKMISILENQLKQDHPDFTFNRGQVSHEYLMVEYLMNDEEMEQSFRLKLNDAGADISELKAGIRFSTSDIGASKVYASVFYDADGVRTTCNSGIALEHKGEASPQLYTESCKQLGMVFKESEELIEKLGNMNISDVAGVVQEIRENYSIFPKGISEKVEAELRIQYPGGGTAIDVYLALNDIIQRYSEENKISPTRYLNLSEQVAKLMHLPFERIDQGEEWKKI